MFVISGLAAEEVEAVRKVLAALVPRQELHPLQDQADFKARLACHRTVLVLSGGGPQGRNPADTLRFVSGLRPEAPFLGLVRAGKHRNIHASSNRMHALIEDMLRLSKVTSRGVVLEPVDLSAMSLEILASLVAADPARTVGIDVAEGLRVVGDASLLRITLENLLSNAWKCSSTRARAHKKVGEVGLADGVPDQEGTPIFFVRDDGVGFDMDNAGRLFEPFQGIHSSRDFPGTGIGLATVHRVLANMGGRCGAIRSGIEDRRSQPESRLRMTYAGSMEARRCSFCFSRAGTACSPKSPCERAQHREFRCPKPSALPDTPCPPRPLSAAGP